MAIPKVEEQAILDAIKYIDEHGVPDKNKSTKYELVTEDGKRYPPKYVIAVAALLRTVQILLRKAITPWKQRTTYRIGAS